MRAGSMLISFLTILNTPTYLPQKGDRTAVSLLATSIVHSNSRQLDSVSNDMDRITLVK